MKTNFTSRKLTKTTLFLALIAAASLCVLAVYVWDRTVHEEFRKSITFEEAQSLVEFQVCQPTYFPSGIDPTPRIFYDAQEENIPEETYIRLQYRRLNDRDKIFEIYQRYTQNPDTRTDYPTEHGGAKASLLYWRTFPLFLSEKEIEAAMTRTQMTASVFQTDGTVWWLYEITDPIEYRSAMANWIKNHVEYRILSFLPVDELEKITLSMMECSNP